MELFLCFSTSFAQGQNEFLVVRQLKLYTQLRQENNFLKQFDPLYCTDKHHGGILSDACQIIVFTKF